MINDTERLEWYFCAPKSDWFVAEYLRGVREEWDVAQWRAAIDVARAALTSQAAPGMAADSNSSEIPNSCPCRKILLRLLPYITAVDHIHISEQPRELLYASEVYDAIAGPCSCDLLRADLARLRRAEFVARLTVDQLRADLAALAEAEARKRGIAEVVKEMHRAHAERDEAIRTRDEALEALRESQLLFVGMSKFVKSYGLDEAGPHPEYDAWMKCCSDFGALKLHADVLLAKHAKEGKNAE